MHDILGFVIGAMGGGFLSLFSWGLLWIGIRFSLKIGGGAGVAFFIMILILIHEGVLDEPFSIVYSILSNALKDPNSLGAAVGFICGAIYMTVTVNRIVNEEDEDKSEMH